MTENNMRRVFKWISVALIVISAIMMFRPALVIEDKSARKEFKQSIRELSRTITTSLAKTDEKDFDEGQKELDEKGIDINLKKFSKNISSFADAVEDAKVSPYEIGAIKSVIPDFAELIEKIDGFAMAIEYSFKDMDFGSSDDLVDMLKGANRKLSIANILFYLTLAASLIVIVLHIINNKLPGVSVVILDLIWLILWSSFKNNVNDKAVKADEFLGVTAAPVWAFILALLAMFIWIFRELIASKIGNGGIQIATLHNTTNRMSGNTMNTSKNTLYCANCGNALNQGAVFCPMCGTKYEAPAETVQSTETEIEPKVKEPDVCPNCGAELDDDAVFCGACGYKR